MNCGVLKYFNAGLKWLRIRVPLRAAQLHTAREPNYAHQLQVRQATSVKDLSFISNIAREENWGWAEGDEECFFAADPLGHYIGELDDKQVCSTAIIKYPANNVCHIGLGATDCAFRRCGFNRAINQFALKRLPRGYIKQMDVLTHLTNAKHMQFELNESNTVFTHQCTLVESTNTVQQLQADFHDSRTQSFEIVPTMDCHSAYEQCSRYENKAINLYRPAFLAKWIGLPGRYGWIAMNRDGQTTGFAVCRQIINPSNVYKVAPLYADTPDIARSLLYHVAQHIHSVNPRSKLYLDVPSTNSEAVKIMSSMGGKVLWKLLRVRSKVDDLSIDTSRVYGVTSQSVG